MAAPVESAGIFPSMVSMVMVGENGRLSEMLVKIAEATIRKLTAVDGLTSIIEPVLIIFWLW